VWRLTATVTADTRGGQHHGGDDVGHDNHRLRARKHADRVTADTETCRSVLQH
jgi:hypothetical protein